MWSVAFFPTGPDSIFLSFKRAFILTCISLAVCLTVLFFFSFQPTHTCRQGLRFGSWMWTEFPLARNRKRRMRKSSQYRFALGPLPFIATGWRHRPVGKRNASVFSKWESCLWPIHSSLKSGVRPRLCGEKLSPVKESPSHPSYPGRANFSYIFLQNLTNRLHEKQKFGSAKRVTRLAGSPSFVGRVTLLAGPTFLRINTLAHPAGPTRSRRDDQSMREHADNQRPALDSDKGVNFFLIYSWLG